MSAIYDNWERLVAAVLKKEQLWQLFHADSVSPSISSDSSGFSFCHLNSSLDDVPFCLLDLEWYASDDFGPKSILSTSKNENYAPQRKRDLKIEVPESQAKAKWADDAKQPSYPLPLPPTAKSAAESRAENVESPWKKGKLLGKGPLGEIAEKLHVSWMMDSPYWMAPEVIINPDVHSLAVDIWSLGCTVLEMATSKPPLSQYDGAIAIFRVAYQEELPAIPPHLSADCKDFLRHCLQWNPMHRATASQLLEHPFVKVSSPLEKKVANSQGSDQARDVRRLDSGKIVSTSSYASKSKLSSRSLSSPLLLPSHPSPPTPRSVLDPTSPPISPQHTTSTSSTGNGAIQLPHLKQYMIHQESFRGFPKQSPNSNSPSYWDPNILRGMLRFS